jgi:hypothetical protein
MRITPAIMLASIVACSSPSKSLEPTEPARSVGTASSSSDEAQAPAGATTGSAAERITHVMALFEKLVVAFEPADGDCEAMAERITAFSKTEDAAALKAMSRDPELDAFMKAHKAELERDYSALKDRFIAVMQSCSGDEDVQDAIGKSNLFYKKRDDGTIIED